MENVKGDLFFGAEMQKKTPLATRSSFKGELNENGHNRGLHK